MIYNRLKRYDIEIPRIGLGTVQFGLDYGFTKAKNQNEVNDILDCCLVHGINFIDTARDYGDSEEKIGSYIKMHPEANITVSTKIGYIKEGQCKNENFKNVVRQSIETSLQCLQKASIELLSLHQTDEYIIHNSDFWEVINEFKERNIIHLFGVSVYEVENARELINEYGDFIDFIQIPYNIFDRRFDQIASLLTEKNIDVVSRSAYLKGIITIVEQEIPKELSNIKKFKRKLADLAESLNFNVQMLALLFVLNKEYISTTILGVNNTKEIEENVQALSKRGQLLDYEELLRELSIKDEFLIDPRRWKSI